MGSKEFLLVPSLANKRILQWTVKDAQGQFYWCLNGKQLDKEAVNLGSYQEEGGG